MTEFVYALHDFSPEHDDEIDFKAGERIQVVEKDDLYSDGWWQGRNLAGKVGLFPQAYTSASAPVPEVRTLATLHSLQEETSKDAIVSPPSPVPAPPPPNDTVMAATLTDVQEAIEQLAVRHDQDTDAARSFSFASTRDPDTETEDELGEDADGQGWHKDARKALAERAEKENAKKLREEEEANGFASPRRKSQSTPPIAVELSDESDADDEDEEAIRSRHHDIHPHHHIYSASKSTPLPVDKLLDDPPEPSALQPAITLTQRTSQSSLLTPTSPSSPQEHEVEITIHDPPALVHPKPQTPTTATTARFHPSIAPPSHIVNITGSLPSPATSSTGGAAQAVSVPLPKSPAPGVTNGSNGLASPRLHSIEQTVPQTIPLTNQQSTLPADPITPPQSSDPPAAESIRDSPSRTHPSEWTVEQVVEWLKSKNVDEATCAKFVEHEITGDVLLELDVAILKEELNITAFGKRMRIANGILELRRPASFSSDPTGFQNNFPGPVSPQGTADWSGHRQEVSSNTSGDARSPGPVLTSGSQKNRPAQLTLSSPSDSALNTKAHGGSETLVSEKDEGEVAERGVQSDTETAPGMTVTKRRNLLGRSIESGSSRGDKDKDRDNRSVGRRSNEVTSQFLIIPHSPSLRGHKTSPIADDGSSVVAGLMPQHMKGKRSIDGSKASERLSFFSTTLGKSRKPPPRYSIYENDAAPTQSTPERMTRSITRLYLGGSTRRNGRPGTPSKEAKESKVSSEINRDAAILRKRKVSSVTPVTIVPKPATATPLQPAAKVALKPGQSVLDQIGRPDHAGWLRKKGVRYNTWKLRYLVLKGPHLYYLRSNGHSETKIKGYINVHGYKVIADENANPGKYGFRIIHDNEPSHFFSSEEQIVVREWMKALMKATIDRDFSKPVMSSCNIPTIPLAVAQAMNPAPRPPSPSARAATQKALRRENPNQLSSRDARVLMGLSAPENDVSAPNDNGGRLESFFSFDPVELDNIEETHTPVPPRPSREMRTPNNRGDADRVDPTFEIELVNWANSVLPGQYRIRDLRTDLSSGLVLLRLAETLGGKRSVPPVPDSIFVGDNLEGMFKLFDFLLENDVNLGTVSINDVKQGRSDKIVQLLREIKAMGEKRKAAV